MVPTCLAGRLWLLLACVVLSGSFPAVSGLYLLGCAFLAVARAFSFLFLARLSPFQRRACLVAAGSAHFWPLQSPRCLWTRNYRQPKSKMRIFESAGGARKRETCLLLKVQGVKRKNEKCSFWIRLFLAFGTSWTRSLLGSGRETPSKRQFFFNSFLLSSAGACLLAPFWSLPFCFFLLFLACFPPSGLRACLLARFWLSLACAVLSGSLSAVCGSYLLGWASLAVPCLRCPLWLVSCCLWFVPAWSGVSGCCLPALSCLARFRPSTIPTCLAGRLWLYLACVVLSGSFLAVSRLYLLGGVSLAVACLFCPVRLVSGGLRFLPAWLDVSGCFFPAVSGLYLLGCAFLAVARAFSFPFSGSPLAVSASCLLGCCWLCAFLTVVITALSLNPQLQAAKIKNAYFRIGRRRPKTRNLPATEGSRCQAQKWKKCSFWIRLFLAFGTSWTRSLLGSGRETPSKRQFFPAVLRWCLLACAFLVVTFLLLPSVFGLFPAVWASCLLACAFLAVACLRCPVRLAFGRLWFLPAWLGVSGCTLPALFSLARFLPSLVCTCLVGCLWLLPACSVLSGSFPAVCGSYLLGWASLALPCLRCPVWLVSCRLWFVPAWLVVW